MPNFLAMMAMCWLFMINSFTVFGFIIFTNKAMASIYTKQVGIVFVIFIFVIHYLYFSSSRKQKIMESYSEEGKSSMLVGAIGVAAYVFFTFWIFLKFIVPNVAGILK